MDIRDLIGELRRTGLHLWLEGDAIRYRAMTCAPVSRSRLSVLREHRSAIRTFLLEEERQAADAGLPVSFVQRAFVGSYDGLSDPRAQHPALAGRLTGVIDEAALRASLGHLGALHATLRTRYRRTDRGELRAVLGDGVPAFAVADVSEDASASRALRVREICDAWHAERFDLGRGPLWRFGLVRITPVEHVFQIVAHHSICDGWSLGLIQKQLLDLYSAVRAARPLPVPYVYDHYDYVRELLCLLESPEGLAMENYWRRRIAGARCPFYLPEDGAGVATAAAAPVHSLPGAVFGRLRLMAQRGRVTPFLCALTAFVLALARWSGEAEVYVATLSAGRHRRELADLIGCFIKVWLLRVDLAASTSFVDVLRLVGRAYLESLDHIEVPYGRIKQQLATDSGVQPLLDVTFNYRPYVADVAAVEGLSVENLAPKPAREALDEETGSKLFVTFIEGAESLEWYVQYSPRRFSPEAIAWLSRTLRTLLEFAAGDHRESLPALAEPPRRAIGRNDS